MEWRQQKRIIDRYKDIKVIILTAESESPISKHTIKFGVSGYITKGSGIDEMVRGIKQVKAGQRFISPVVAQKLALSMLNGDQSPLDRLSKRELEVLIRITQGQSKPRNCRTTAFKPENNQYLSCSLIGKAQRIQ